ncbi:VOC family protein [Blastococcus sp. BMG 814]|uniref:VOC family protein n=1 Tax=Blastococcus carthaginiensis TaxID=3050034 RepID=A0ABT9I6A2_9ACTN|nr:VOC family protein [Blastococcus carthaginiensis]MDP5181099.1 VOC family protein [Blastococcus carthaginiensis]
MDAIPRGTADRARADLLPAGRPAAQLIQICFVVSDLDASLRRFSATFGAGPWFLATTPAGRADPTVYRGRPTPLDAEIALAYGGDVMYELVRPRPGSVSVFREGVDRSGLGIHHLGFATEDFDATLSRLGSEGRELLCTSVTPRGARVAIVGGGPPLGVLEEYIELTPATREFYAHMRARAAEWDGRELVCQG